MTATAPPAAADEASPPTYGLGSTVGWRPRRPSLVESGVGAAVGAQARLLRPLLSEVAADAFVGALKGERRAPRPDDEIPGWGDPGWFGPGSATWTVHGDHSMIVSGFAAFALQLLHPLALAGVVEHSAFDGDFMGRTRRTGEYVMTVSFGTTDEAERATAMLPRIHSRVVGHAPDGRPYSANDPELLEWVHLTQHVASAAAHQRFGAHPLDDAGLDRYIAESARVGRANGVEDPPETWDDAMDRLDRHRPQLALGEQGNEARLYLASPPFLPDVAKPLWSAFHTGALSCLPPFARRLMNVERASTAEIAACRALIRGFAALVPPSPLIVEAQRRTAHL